MTKAVWIVLIRVKGSVLPLTLHSLFRSSFGEFFRPTLKKKGWMSLQAIVPKWFQLKKTLCIFYISVMLSKERELETEMDKLKWIFVRFLSFNKKRSACALFRKTKGLFLIPSDYFFSNVKYSLTTSFDKILAVIILITHSTKKLL